MHKFEKEIIKRIKLFGGGYANVHTHLDRTGTINLENLVKSQKNLKDKWDMVTKYKQNTSVSGLSSRMYEEVENQIRQGVTQLITFLDFDSDAQDKPFKAYSIVKEKINENYPNTIDLKCVNQTLKGVINSEARDWFNKGAETCDFVGGLPGKDEGRESEHLDIIFKKAKELNKKLHIHVDQFSTPLEIETKLVLDKIEKYDYSGKVFLIHCLSLNCHDLNYRKHIYKRIKDTNTSIICCPRAWMDREKNDNVCAPIHNPSTPVKEMIENGINIENIYVGTDNISDMMLPFSDGDMFKELDCFAMLNRLYDIDKLVTIFSNKIK